MSDNRISSQFSIKVNGQEAPPDVRGDVQEVTVDQHVHLPGMFVIRVSDPRMERLDGGPFDLTKEVEIAAETEEGDPVVLIKGEITALEPSFNEGMIAELVVRGYDKSHRLFRELKSAAHLNKKDSDLANDIAAAVGLQAEVETTDTVYEHIFQHNQSDLAFLMQRAWRIGYECFVDDGKLVFRKPPTNAESVTLTWGSDLQTFQPRLTLAEQVDEVLVRGWDTDKLEPIVGRAAAADSRLYPQLGETRNGAQWAGAFGAGKLVIVDQPVVSQAEANTLAAARLNEATGAYVQAEGRALRRPDIRAGRMVQIEGLGRRLSGKYLVTSATHTYSPTGLSTTFTVRGARSGLAAEELAPRSAVDRRPGVAPAIVTGIDDPQGQGRIKVKFPWMTDDAESHWARVVSVGAGPKAGLLAIPAVNDEVLVAFEHGDFGRPYILGGLWSGKHNPPDELAGGGEQDKVRVWRSPGGHVIAVYDDSKKKIEIKTAGGHLLVLDDQNKKVEVKTSGGHTIVCDDNGRKVQIESAGDVQIKANMNVKLEAGANLELQASGQITIKGAMVNLN